MRIDEGGPLEMRAEEDGPFEMGVTEVGPLEVRLVEDGPPRRAPKRMAPSRCASLRSARFQNRAAKIEPPIVGALPLPTLLTSPTNHYQNRGNIGCRRLSKFFLLGGLRPKIFRLSVWPAGFLPEEIGAPRYPLLQVLRGAFGFVPARAFQTKAVRFSITVQ